MKTKLLLLFLCITTFNITAQNITIPDGNFKSILVANYDAGGDNEISVAEAAAVTGTIDVSGSSISDVTGLEAFVNITGLNVENNIISSINLSQNINLSTVDVDDNNLEYVDVSMLMSLQFLYASNNQLNYINVNQNANLFSLVAQNNPLMAAVNLDNGNSSSIFLVDITNNTSLTCIQVDATALSNPPSGWSKDAMATYSSNCPVFCIIDIPDVNFKNYLLASGNDLNSDNEIQCSEALLFNGTLSVNGLGITDLTGVEALANISQLHFFSNPITGDLDLSQNTLITSIRGFNANLNSIDTGNNSNLTNLEVYNNPSLSLIDLTGNPNLQTATINNNNLSTIDFSQNINLSTINLSNNPMTTIDLSANINLTYMTSIGTPFTGSFDFSNLINLEGIRIRNANLTALNVANGNNSNFYLLDVQNNPNLLCVEVDDANLVTNASWSYENSQTSYSEDCVAFLCTINIPDANFKTELVNNVNINLNGDGEIQCNEAQMFSGIISVGGKNIVDMTGIEHFVNLTELICFANQITDLDVSANVDLTSLLCNLNALTTLKVANGNNSNFTNFNATSNPSLLCIEVDNISYSNGNWPNKDTSAVYSVDCAATLSTETFNLTKNDINLYPNPTSSLLNIKMKAKLKQATIYSVLGRQVLKTTSKRINTNNLPNGMFLISIEDETGNSVTKRFIKQ